MASLRKGRFTTSDDRYIRANFHSLTADQMAKHLKRRPQAVDEYVKKKYKMGATSLEKAQYTLKERPYYQDLAQQFTDRELDIFEYHWTKIVAQFNTDVLPTEELQIIDVIKMELLMNRALVSLKYAVDQINSLEARKAVLLEASGGTQEDEDLEQLENLEHRIASLRAAQDSTDRNFREMQAKKSSIIKEMKGTREQRIKKLEDSKESFPEWVGQLIRDPEKLKTMGVEMEKKRLAMEAERARLSKEHVYADGQVDRPLLNEESILLEE